MQHSTKTLIAGLGVVATSLALASPAMGATARMAIAPNPASAGAPVHFDGSASTGDFNGIGCPSLTLSYHDWDLDGDGTTDKRGARIQHIYSRGGAYRVSLTVGTAVWCPTDTATETLSVLQPGAEPPRNTGAPSISGRAELGEQLRASDGSWSGTTPMLFDFQWYRCGSDGNSCVAISGAKRDSYTVNSDDVGRTIRVEVRATNGGGYSEPSPMSAQTAVVPPPPPPPPVEDTVHDVEENNDNDADRYIPPAVDDALIVPDPDAHLDEAACGSEGDTTQASCLPAGEVAAAQGAPGPAPDPEANCGPGCPVFWVSDDMPESEIPDWVKAMGVYSDAKAEGIPTDNTLYFGSQAAVAYAAIVDGPSCPRRHVCLYQHTHYRTSSGTKGRHFRSNRVNFTFALEEYGMRNKVSSWINKRTRNWANMSNPEGAHPSDPQVRRMPPKHRSPHVGSFNDKADYFRICLVSSGTFCL